MLEDNQLTIQSYWDIEAKEIRFAQDSDYAERFYELLEDSIRLRLRSDVPIGILFERRTGFLLNCMFGQSTDV